MQILPQFGPQWDFLCCDADIALYGGAAGGGKTFSLLMLPLQFRSLRFDTVIFRRTTPEILNPGGLWDESCKLYPAAGGRGRLSGMNWTWSEDQRVKLRVKFAHLEDRDTVYNWQGSQVPMICFDELTHFDESQFWYMISRNRSLSGEPGKMRATTNPDCDSWVAKLVEWYIGQDGYPIPERAGVKRFMVRDGETLVWGSTREELTAKYDPSLVMSFAFFPALVEDNAILLEKDPAYLARLNMLPYVDRMRLRFGNWIIRAVAGNVFKAEWFEVLDQCPPGGKAVRYWDRAATEKRKEGHDPDWTVGVKLLKLPQYYLVEDVVRLRETPAKVQAAIRNTATADGKDVAIGLEQDPGQAGVSEADHLVRMLDGYNVRRIAVSRSKLDRAKPVSAQAENGCVKLLRASWNAEFTRELGNFPDGPHDDQTDALSGAYGMFASERRIFCA